jgi:hypothetical protein
MSWCMTTTGTKLVDHRSESVSLDIPSTSASSTHSPSPASDTSSRAVCHWIRRRLPPVATQLARRSFVAAHVSWLHHPPPSCSGGWIGSSQPIFPQLEQFDQPPIESTHNPTEPNQTNDTRRTGESAHAPRIQSVVRSCRVSGSRRVLDSRHALALSSSQPCCHRQSTTDAPRCDIDRSRTRRRLTHSLASPCMFVLARVQSVCSSIPAPSLVLSPKAPPRPASRRVVSCVHSKSTNDE